MQTILSTVITSAISLAVMFFLAKFIGNKQLSEINLFDYINGITIGSMAADFAISEPGGRLKPLSAMIFYGIATAVLSFIASKSRKARGFLSGKATILMTGGKIRRDALAKTRLDLDEFLAMLRVNGYFDLSQLETVILEPNGRISVLPKSMYRPLTPADSGIDVAAESIFLPVIMDGRIMDNNLQRAGKDRIWLSRELKKQGAPNEKDIFLAVCNKNNTLNIF